MCASVGRAFRLANARVSESGPSRCQSHAQRGGGLCANRFACLLALLYDTKILPYTISHPYQSSTASYTFVQQSQKEGHPAGRHIGNSTCTPHAGVTFPHAGVKRHAGADFARAGDTCSQRGPSLALAQGGAGAEVAPRAGVAVASAKNTG